MSDAARACLWEWVAETDDPDPEQRTWKRQFAGGMLEAVERTGLLEPAEVARHRAVLDGAPVAAATQVDEAAAVRHVEALRRDLRPATREDDPEALAAQRRHDGALAALAAAGALTGDRERELRRAGLATLAPWLDPDDVEALVGHDGVYALEPPPATAEEEAEDAAAETWADRVAAPGPIERVLVAERLHAVEGVTVLAAVLRAEAIELHTHVVRPAPADGPASTHRVFEELVDELVPPRLADERGTAYAPYPFGPSGPGHTTAIDGVRHVVSRSTWQYHPAAPPGTARLTAELDDARWTLA
jgi:hypothetical protein